MNLTTKEAKELARLHKRIVCKPHLKTTRAQVLRAFELQNKRSK